MAERKSSVDSAKVRTCYVCQRRHRKCDGMSPCSLCTLTKSECVYATARRMGRKPKQEPVPLDLIRSARLYVAEPRPLRNVDAGWLSVYMQYYLEYRKEWMCGLIPTPSMEILLTDKSIMDTTTRDKEERFLLYSALAAGSAMSRTAKCMQAQRQLPAADMRAHDDLLHTVNQTWADISSEPISSPLRSMGLILWNLAVHVGSQPALLFSTATSAYDTIDAAAEADPQLMERSALARWTYTRACNVNMKMVTNSSERQAWITRAQHRDLEFPISHIATLAMYVVGELMDPECANLTQLSSCLDQCERVIDHNLALFSAVDREVETSDFRAWKTLQICCQASRTRMAQLVGEVGEAQTLMSNIVQDLTLTWRQRPTMPCVVGALSMLQSVCETVPSALATQQFIELMEAYSRVQIMDPETITGIQQLRIMAQESVEGTPTYQTTPPDGFSPSLLDDLKLYDSACAAAIDAMSSNANDERTASDDNLLLLMSDPTPTAGESETWLQAVLHS